MRLDGDRVDLPRRAAVIKNIHVCIVDLIYFFCFRHDNVDAETTETRVKPAHALAVAAGAIAAL